MPASSPLGSTLRLPFSGTSRISSIRPRNDVKRLYLALWIVEKRGQVFDLGPVDLRQVRMNERFRVRSMVDFVLKFFLATL